MYTARNEEFMAVAACRFAEVFGARFRTEDESTSPFRNARVANPISVIHRGLNPESGNGPFFPLSGYPLYSVQQGLWKFRVFTHFEDVF
jgi:hypothetical protein